MKKTSLSEGRDDAEESKPFLSADTEIEEKNDNEIIHVHDKSETVKSSVVSALCC